MVGKGIAQARMGKLMAFKEEKQKLADQAAVNNPAVDKIAYADRPKAMQEASPSVVQSAQEANPSLQKMTWKNTGIVPMPGQGEYRQEALRDMDEDTFRKHQGKMNASDYEYWTEKLKANPGSEYVVVNQMLASKETPEEKAKRERREALGETFRGLGNLIGNAANLYYATKGGTPIDLNTANEKHLERMQRIKDKQDALDEQRKQLIVNAKLGEIQAARKAKADKEQREYEEKVRGENRAYQEKKDKQSQANWEAQFEYNKKQADQAAADKAEEKAYRREQDKNNLAYKWAELNFRKENAKNSSGGTKKSSVDVVNTKKGAMNVDFSKLNDTSIAQLYQRIPEEIRKKYDISSIENRNEKLLRMNEAIGDALMNVDGYSDWFEQTGVGSYQQQKAKDYSQYDITDDYSEYTRKTGQSASVSQGTNNVPTANDIQAALNKKNEKKGKLLQSGKDSLYRNSGYSMKSDTFR